MTRRGEMKASKADAGFSKTRPRPRTQYIRTCERAYENTPLPTAIADAEAVKGKHPSSLFHLKPMSQPPSPSARPIPDRHLASARAAPEVLDWEQVDPRVSTTGRDPLGLTPADRQALGLSAPRMLDLTLPHAGGAEAALAELLAEGVALGKREPKRRR
jgi:hypothetical protein